MRLTYAGCNLFGQVVTSQALAIDHFIDYHIDDPPLIDIALGHSIIAYLRADGLFFHGHGLRPRQTHHVTQLAIPANPKRVRASDTRVFLLDHDGEIYVLDFLDRQPTFVRKPCYILRDSGTDKVVDFVAGTAINVALTEAGCVYNVPNKLEFPLAHNAKVQKICAGHEHCLMLDTLGNVYSFGNGRRGQLGHGILENEDAPCQVQTLAGIFIVDVACGGWHSMALSRDGDVYIWGWNSDGQLGLVDDDSNESVSVVTTPQYLPLSDDLNVTHIASGGRHSICITSENNVYAFGCNKFNQLGLTDNNAVINRPTKVHQILNSTILRVDCGPTSTSILTLDENE